MLLMKSKKKGSVLVFSLIVLAIVLSSALSITMVNVSNRKSAASTAQSVQSFQTADTAAEMVLKAVYNGNYASLSGLYHVLNPDGATCPNPMTVSVSGGTARVSFLGTGGASLTTTDCSSALWRDSLVSVKVEGSANSNGAVRVLEIAIAPLSSMAWGNSHDGQVGDGTHGNFTDHYSPVPTIGGSRWKSVSAGPGSTHALAVRTDGTLWAWGNGGNYRLGNNSTSDVTSPVQIGTETDWQFVSSGFNHSLAIKAGGTQLWAWGNNATHQLGDGTTIARTAPVQITSCSPSCPSAWQFISAGQNYSLAIGDGNLYVWGENTSHKLGNATGETNIPTKIVSCSPSCPLVWQAVSAGFSHSLGIGDGYLYAWGDRNNGKLGDGTPLVELPTPKKIGTDSWVAVSAGAEFSLGIQTDHTLWSWGSDASGQLGNGSVNSSDVTTPAQVTISALVDQGNWQSISAGSSHALAIKTNGSNRDLYAWGNNNHGQVASGDNPQVSPILISGNWQAASAGNTFSIGVRK